MAVRQHFDSAQCRRRYGKEEMARRGQKLYESGIRAQVEADNEGKIVAIDIETRAFEVDENLAESETEPLLGMSLLYGYQLQVDAIEGGGVRIEAL